MLNETEIGKRKPVWVALSELWLDRELAQDDLEWIARTLVESEFTIDQLREIYLREVAPAVWTNLLATAGEWSGFDPEWLSTRIVRHLERPFPCSRLMASLPFTRRWMTHGTEVYWSRLVERVRTLREQGDT